jgi:hypothetical protein
MPLYLDSPGYAFDWKEKNHNAKKFFKIHFQHVYRNHGSNRNLREIGMVANLALKHNALKIV